MDTHPKSSLSLPICLPVKQSPSPATGPGTLRLRGYFIAAAAIAAAFLLRLAFDPLWGNRLAFAWFFLAVLAVTRWAALGPQILAVAAGLVLGDWFFIDPRYSFLISNQFYQVNAVIYVVVCSCVLLFAAHTRRAKARELEARDRIAGILECTSDAVCTVDREWNVTYFNARASELTQLEPAHVIGRSHWEIWPEMVGTRFEQEYRRVLEHKKPVHFEELHPFHSQWIEVHACPYGDGVAIFFRDISHRKKAEAERAHLAAIVESSDDAIIAGSLDGLIVTWNAAAETMYGYSSAEAVGRSLSMLFPTERADEMKQLLERVRTGGRVQHFETKQLTRTGAMADVSLTLSPVQTREMHIIGISITARDVSERKRQETERERLIAQLQAALAEIKTLSGLLPICSHCKKVREDDGSWKQIESYIRDRSNATFTHGICPGCAHELYPEVADEV